MNTIQKLRAASAVTTQSSEDQTRTRILIRARELRSQNKKLSKTDAIKLATEEINQSDQNEQN